MSRRKLIDMLQSPPPSATSSQDREKAAQRSFTGDKLDWMTALSADPRLDARAFEVGFQIAQHVNKDSGLAVLSDETICDKTAIPRRWIARARSNLRNCGWIDWKRTKTANIYWTRGEHMNAVMDHQIMLKDCRNDKRTKLRTARQVVPPMAHLKLPDMPPVAHAEPPPVAHRDLPPVANIHLSGNTLVDTPSKVQPSKEEGCSKEEQPYDPDNPPGYHLPGESDTASHPKQSPREARPSGGAVASGATATQPPNLLISPEALRRLAELEYLRKPSNVTVDVLLAHRRGVA